MAFKFTKEELARRDEYVGKLREVWTELDKLRAQMESHTTLYNETLSEASGWMEDVCARLSSEYDEKSEKWQEGERGEAVRSWIDDLEGLDLEEVSFDMPEPEHADTLEQIEVEVQP